MPLLLGCLLYLHMSKLIALLTDSGIELSGFCNMSSAYYWHTKNRKAAWFPCVSEPIVISYQNQSTNQPTAFSSISYPMCAACRSLCGTAFWQRTVHRPRWKVTTGSQKSRACMQCWHTNTFCFQADIHWQNINESMVLCSISCHKAVKAPCKPDTCMQSELSSQQHPSVYIWQKRFHLVRHKQTKLIAEAV